MDSPLIQTVSSHLIQEAGVQPEKLDEFLNETCEHLKQIMLSLDDAIDDGEFETVVSTAYKLQGALTNLGLEELSMVAKNIKTIAGSNSPAHLSCYFMRLRRELNSFLG
ncbi:Hpt domain-containing protein [Maridesulfovibrio hydrothermalis]|uniref:Hpt protein n=1 Tax=Maridesulfovibrio hydrothermalis AM13 = DSM 14728 TaxID=1121451 RepID=L0RFG7_9BACT|nr:Hpt domain-containing protein [Maridesulfovibrio hydrothermalis]CCO24925.1 Hpt protein [Maridesulfovibrio hydrothermalis AM13 = DSM 14728]